jgi:hypothetical protein
MKAPDPPRVDHLRRLTDTRGLLKSAWGDCPDRFAGYSATDNANALRLCADASDSVDGDRLQPLAMTYERFLRRACRGDGGVHHHGNPAGSWSDTGDDGLVQAIVGRALSSVMRSELPIRTRLASADWWRRLVPYSDGAGSARAAANWVIAFHGLRPADPGRDLTRAARLADWLVDKCYRGACSGDWQWFEPVWRPGAACIAAAMWCAHEMLGQARYLEVAEATTQFVVDHLFEDGLFVPPGTQHEWTWKGARPVFDQTPEDAVSVVELLCLADSTLGEPRYESHALHAGRWFEGNNVKGVSLIDAESGACHDSLTQRGASPDCGGTAMVAYLLTHVALSRRTTVAEEPTFYSALIHG